MNDKEETPTPEEILEIHNMTDEQLIDIILFSDCLSKEYCDVLSEEFDSRKLDWNILYES